MNPLQLALDIARRLVTVPLSAPTVDELARALHVVDNDGRIARYGNSPCRHPEKAARVLEYLRERPQ